jgi:hypothetical protein
MGPTANESRRNDALSPREGFGLLREGPDVPRLEPGASEGARVEALPVSAGNGASECRHSEGKVWAKVSANKPFVGNGHSPSAGPRAGPKARARQARPTVGRTKNSSPTESESRRTTHFRRGEASGLPRGAPRPPPGAQSRRKVLESRRAPHANGRRARAMSQSSGRAGASVSSSHGSSARAGIGALGARIPARAARQRSSQRRCGSQR